jgi:hypothetical protein
MSGCRGLSLSATQLSKMVESSGADVGLARGFCSRGSIIYDVWVCIACVLCLGLVNRTPTGRFTGGR